MAAFVAALFDKSFLQSLSIDDSVWLDQYFRSVACPIFFAETLADLAKPGLEGQAAQNRVGIIASKFPERHASPCAFHIHMAQDNLLGLELPMDGRIPRAGGRYVNNDGKSGIVFDHSPEERAFERWRAGHFLEVEKQYAAGWRESVAETDLVEMAKAVRAKGINGQTCKTLADAKILAEQFTHSETTDLGPLRMAALALGVPSDLHRQLIERWMDRGRPSLSRFAPYAAFVLRIELFFQIAMAASLISPDRPSNRMDVAYLCYLPFCHVFVSADRLHQRTAPLFLRDDQQFIWGPDLKADLSNINSHFMTFPEAERERGLYQFGSEPPETSLTRSIIDRVFPRSVPHLTEDLASKLTENDPEAVKRLIERFKAKIKAPTVKPMGLPTGETLDMLAVESRVSLKRGSWFQLPKGFKADAESTSD